MVAYLRDSVLKKREARLKREQNGLKSLIGGLVGGPALLKEWEHEWREKFGGEEKDEVEGEEAEPMSDDDDGDEEGDGDEDEGRVKKKVKVVKAPKPVKKATAPTTTGDYGVVPEKRKRGRPRKVNMAPTSTTTPPDDTTSLIPSVEPVQHQQPIAQDSHPQQYLLATFALFSFFNSPLTSTSRSESHSHSGSVLGHAAIVQSTSYGWREFIQAFHLVVSALVFFSVVVPWLPKVIKRTHLLSPFAGNFPSLNATTFNAPTPKPVSPRVTLFGALAHSRRGVSDEAEQLRSALGVPSGILGLVMGLSRSNGEGFERKGLEQRAWVRLGELVALNRK